MHGKVKPKKDIHKSERRDDNIHSTVKRCRNLFVTLSLQIFNVHYYHLFALNFKYRLSVVM